MNQKIKNYIRKTGLTLAFLALNPLSLYEGAHRLRYELLETKPTNSYLEDGTFHTISRDKVDNSLYIQTTTGSKRFYDTNNDGNLDSLVMRFAVGLCRVAAIGTKTMTHKENPKLFDEANQLYQKYKDRFDR